MATAANDGATLAAFLSSSTISEVTLRRRGVVVIHASESVLKALNVRARDAPWTRYGP